MTFEAAIVVVGVVVKPGRRQDRRGARRLAQGYSPGAGSASFHLLPLPAATEPAAGSAPGAGSASFHLLPPRCVGAPSSKRYPNSDVNARHRSATCSLEYSV